MIQILVEIHSRTIFAWSFWKIQSTIVRPIVWRWIFLFFFLRSPHRNFPTTFSFVNFLHYCLGRAWTLNKHLCIHANINLFRCLFTFNIYRGANYNLLKHNCNTFSEDLCQFLCGTSIPKYILDLPQEILSTPIGQTLAPLIGKKYHTRWSWSDSEITLFSWHFQNKSVAALVPTQHFRLNHKPPHADKVQVLKSWILK